MGSDDPGKACPQKFTSRELAEERRSPNLAPSGGGVPFHDGTRASYSALCPWVNQGSGRPATISWLLAQPGLAWSGCNGDVTSECVVLSAATVEPAYTSQTAMAGASLRALSVAVASSANGV